MSIKTRIGVLASAPVLIIALMLSWRVMGLLDEARQMKTLGAASESLSAVNAAIAELQLERGRSSQFLASSDAAGDERLIAQRKRTDTSVVRVAAGATTVDGLLGIDTRRSLAAARDQLAVLEPLRKQISERSLSSLGAIAAYSQLISGMLDVSFAVERSVARPELRDKVLALVFLASATEKAGLARASGAAGLQRKSFDLGLYRQFADANEQEREFLRLFEIYAPADVRRARTESAAKDASLDRMRQAMLARMPLDQIEGIDGGDWFAAATSHIERLHEVQKSLLRIVADDARATESEAFSTFLAAIAVAMVVIAAIAGLALWLAFSITRPLTTLTRVMRRLSDGDLSVEIGTHAGKDEIGAMARSVEVFKANGLERARLERQAAETREAAERERERVAAEKAAAARQQSEAIAGLAVGLRALSRGDLTNVLDDGFAAQFIAIRDDFNAASDELATILRATIEATEAIHNASGEISSASDNLAQRTEQQATIIEVTSASMQDLAQAISRTADSSTRTKTIISEAKIDANDSIDIVRETEKSVDSIRGWSEKISSIIGVIDEIAFQTNLLALNAGVEAARAGDAGRGFAVVASEVRALAQRSAGAAREIKELISHSTIEVTKGVELVKATGAAFDRINSHVSLIDNGIAEIANQTLEQSSALKQVAIVVTEIEQTTQRNAAMAEETNAACRSLVQECGRLSEMTSGFQLPGCAEDSGSTRIAA